MCEPFVGQISMFAGSFAPRGWAMCDGQLLSIADYPALFSLLGTTYGGDGRATFALPDLRGRVPMHAGHGPNLMARPVGEKGGQEQVALTVAEMPGHAHTATAAARAGDTPEPGFAVWAASTHGDAQYAFEPTPGSHMHPEAIQPAGDSGAHDNLPPYQCIHFIIALQGIYPSRQY